ncbi:hypothetical protein RPIT_10350 [Tessaracoccus flavus]|uniref:Uncharacterized protein n=1 Tax=Tessaracoccus flavus TaxID=1610493 RepID=A0A1Q2CGA8_9ACTN|nr:hypothetical protein RPIT_10350 [Tessaracoccus flavus]SDY55183.1 ABC-2 type transport system permease protein [Tessaracoccus flavus]
MNRIFIATELARLRRDPVLLLIVVVLPVFFFLGASVAIPDTLDENTRTSVRDGVMIGLACYGAATAASTITGQTALERVHGWARQVGLTPLATWRFLAVKATVALVAVVATVGVMFTVAAISGILASPLAWLAAGAVVLVGSVTWALYGLVVGLAFRSQSALAASAAGLVLLALGGGVFVPLPEHLVWIARWTPMYGQVELARLALAGGDASAALWPLANWLGWTGVLAGLAAWLVGRSRRRG